MLIEALTPLTIRSKTYGVLRLATWERLDVSERVGAQLQEQIPDKIRVIPEPPARDPLLGQQVTYRFPINIQSGTDYTWQTHTGRVTMVDHANHLALVEPDHEAYSWRWVARVYVEPMERRLNHED